MQLADLSPDQRKLISIVSDENPRIRSARSGLARGAMIGGVPPALAGAAWGARIGASLGPAGMLGGAAAGAAIAAAVPLAVGAAVGGAVRAIRPREYPRILKHQQARVVVALPAQVAGLSFVPEPVPADRILYANHPFKPAIYYRASDFHLEILKDKFWELIRLLRSLGANKIRVEYVRGLSGKINMKAGTMSVEMTHSSDDKVLYEGDLEGHDNPIVPADLAWFDYERDWSGIADGRQNHRERSFRLELSHKSDFGVKADLGQVAAKLGLSLGGEFTSHEETTWRLTGSYGPVGAP